MTVVNTNVKALFAQNSLQVNNRTLTNAMQQLSTGSRINSAKDDAAGLAIGTRMSADLRGMSVAIRNANDGISMMQTAEGALGEISNMLQRMRDLATQSATGSLTASNREALQAEAAQLISEIDNVSRTTNFNGIKLLDGTATELLIQTGVKEGATVGVKISESSAASLGIGTRASLTATGFFDSTVADLVGTTSDNRALASGDLQINGVNIRSTRSIDDSMSSGANAASSISKVAAINSHSAETGVSAKVLTNVAQGSAMSSNATSTGTITINGVATSSFSTTADLGTNRADVVKYINQISAQTGVTAVDTGSATHGVELHAADGRNIVVSFTSLSSAGTGVAATGGYTGGFTLTSETGDPIAITQGVAGDLAKAGLAVGTYEANKSAMTTTSRAVGAASAAPSTSTTGLLNAGVLKINGVDVRAGVSADDTASDTKAVSSTKAASAIAIAAAINAATGSTGVVAKADANVIKGTAFTAGTVGSAFYINGVDISAGSSLSATSTRQDAADQINKFTGQTGVFAADNGVGITLTAEDGRNVSLSGAVTDTASLGILGTATNQGAGATAASAITTYASVTLASDRQFKVESGSDGNGSFGLLGFKTGTFGGADNGMKIEDVEISTQGGASNSITAIDVALEQVSLNRANLGAFQNRLTAAVDNLSTQSTNLAEAKGRIMDTDYAKATTELARSQIVQQAATAMLAQANQQPQMVLSLLQ